jgi:AraC family transcriptional regulator
LGSELHGQEDESSTGRVSVLRDNQLVPLLPSTLDRNSAQQQPWRGILLERHLIKPGEIPEHEHPDLCLHLQLTGQHDFEWWENGRNAIEHTGPGSLIVIPTGTRDRLRWQGPSERLIMSVDNSALEHLASELGAKDPPEIIGAWSLKDSSLQLLITEMGREAQEGWPLGALYADLLAMGLKSSLLKHHSNHPVSSAPHKGSLSRLRVKRAMEYMNANIEEDIELEKVAAELDMSGSHFAHEFRNATGRTPYQYLLDQRMSKATSLLKTTKLPVQYVSGLTGFRSPVNFVRTFRQRIGQTPDAWRRQQELGS